MRILLSGATGLVGAAVTGALTRQGHTVQRLVRAGKALQPGDVRWDPPTGEFDGAAAEGADAVVHLAGASIAGGRLDAGQKALVRASRVDATRHLVGGLAKLQRKPRVLVAASAVGYYGNRGDELLTEQSAPGQDFLASLCCDWEAEAARAEQAGIRVVHLRFGVVFSSAGGALKRMLLPFKLGAGGRLGSGQQWWSWVSLPEAVSIVQQAIENESLRGAVNAAAPNPVRNAEFTKILGRVLRRPTILPAPAFALRLALGEVADLLLLASQRVVPKRLADTGYRFLHPDLEQALRELLAGH
jgi:hypothetical protein